MSDWQTLHTLPQTLLRYPAEVVVRWLAGKDHGSLIDIGCGAGRHTKLAMTMGHQVVATDCSENAIRRAALNMSRNNVPWQPRVCDQKDLPFADESFDYALSYGSAYYEDSLDKMLTAFEEIRRVLKPGGEALIVVRDVTDHRSTLRHSHTEMVTSGLEAGMPMTFVTKAKLRTFLAPWSSYEIGRQEVDWHGRFDADWLCTCTK